jgi:hypothetical protein
MKIDPLKQYAKLHQQLTDERARLVARLAEINAVLKPEVQISSKALDKITSEYLDRELAPPREPRPGTRRRRSAISMREAVMRALAKGPVLRKDLVQAVEAVGYRFTSSNPLNSLGSVIYSKNSPIKSKDGKLYLTGRIRPQASGKGDLEKQAPAKRKKRRLSPEGRARIVAAARARWARQRAGN